MLNNTMKLPLFSKLFIPILIFSLICPCGLFAAGSDSIIVKVTVTAPQPKERIFIYFNGKRIAMEENGEKYFFHSDHLGSTSVVTDSSGNQVKYADYQPYGDTKTEEGSLSVNRKFTGKELDDSTGLYDYGARMYDAAIGRFITPDTINPNLTNPQSLNRYSYCLNNPLKYVDPSGHEPITISAAVYAYIIMVVSAPDFQQDMQQLTLDAQTGDVGGMAIDAVCMAVPGLSATAAQTGRRAISKAVGMAKAGKKAEKSIIKYNSKAGRFYDSATGRFKKVDWDQIAPNEGFLTKSPGKARPGQIVDRYGTPGGRYLSPEGTPYAKRGIPEGFTEYHKYEVMDSFGWTQGYTRPVKEFGSSGMGKQYKTREGIDNLVSKGYLREKK